MPSSSSAKRHTYIVATPLVEQGDNERSQKSMVDRPHHVLVLVFKKNAQKVDDHKTKHMPSFLCLAMTWVAVRAGEVVHTKPRCRR